MERSKINKDILSLVRPSILKLKPYASAKDEFNDLGEDLILLDANENPYETEVNRYPDAYQTELKKIISKQKGIPVNNILLGNGSDEILDMIVRVFCEPKKDNILINTPTFGMYKVLADMNDVSCKKVMLTNDFQLDIPEIINRVDQQTKIVFICSPNNPTGNLISKEDIFKLASLLKVMIVVDEAYIDFTDEISCLERINSFSNLIVTQTLSKAYGLAGIRLGICYADKAVIEILNKIKMPYNVNVLTQKKAMESLREVSKLKAEVSEIKKNKIFLIRELDQIKYVEKVYHSDVNFLLVKVDDANKRYAQLINHGIVVRNRTNEPLCENCLRFTVGTEDEMKKLITVLRSM